MFNQGYGIKFLAAALGLIFLCAFTVVAAPVIAGNSEGGQKTAAVTDVSSEPNAVISGEASSYPELVSYESGGLPAQATSHADSSGSSVSSGLKRVFDEWKDPFKNVPTVSYDWSSEADTYSDTSYITSGSWQATTSYGETSSVLIQPYLTCSKPLKDHGQSDSYNVVSRNPIGLIQMSDKQIRDEINTIQLGRFYDLPTTGESAPFSFDMFYEIIEIIKQYEWQHYYTQLDPYRWQGNLLIASGHNAFYTELIFMRDSEGYGLVQSYDNCKIAYLTEEDYTHICDLLGHARQAD